MKYWMLRYPTLISSALALLLALPWLGGRGLQNPDELRYAAIPLEMLARGDFVVPYLNGVPYFEKPPLVYWLNILSLAAFGQVEWGLRLWPMLSALAMTAMVCRLARRFYGAQAALYAGLVASSALFMSLYSQLVSLDLIVAMLISGALAAFLLAAMDDRPRGRAPYWPLYVLSALAVLAKGLIGMVLPGLVIGIWCLFLRRWDALRACFRLPGILLFLAIAAPWHVLVETRQAGFVDFYFINEHLRRFTTTLHQRDQKIWFLPLALLVGMQPWSGFLGSALVQAWKGWRGRALTAPVELFLLLWSVLVFGFFWMSHSQLPGYLLPMLAPLAILTGRALAGSPSRLAWTAGKAVAALSMAALALGLVLFPEDLIPQVTEESGGGNRIGLMIAAGVLAGAAIICVAGRKVPVMAAVMAGMMTLTNALMVWEDPKSLRALLRDNAQWIGTHDLFAYRTYLLDGTFYLGRPTIFVDAAGELDYGRRLQPRPDLFFNPAMFQQRLKAPEPVYVLLRARHLPEIPGMRIVDRRGGMLLVTNDGAGAEAGAK